MSRQRSTVAQEPSRDASAADGPVRWPFQIRVDQVAAKRFDKEMQTGAAGRRDLEGIEPRLPLNAVYHNLRRTGLWELAGPARVAFTSRLIADGALKRVANSLAWRLLEDALVGCENEDGFDVEILELELDALLAYGEGREYPSAPSPREIAAAIEDRSVLFPAGVNVMRLPTTLMAIYRRLGLWDAAKRVLEQFDPDRGEIGDRSTSGAWRMLNDILASNQTVHEIRDALRLRVRNPK